MLLDDDCRRGDGGEGGVAAVVSVGMHDVGGEVVNVGGTLCWSARTRTWDMMASESVALGHPAARPLAGVHLGPTCR